MKTSIGCAFICMLSFVGAIAQEPTPMQFIKGGAFLPLYSVEKSAVKVKPFYLDVYAVTNRDYLNFVTRFPSYKRSTIKQLFAEKNYLSNWTSDTTFDAKIAQSPVTYISWFAAEKYCESVGKHLPTLSEWEFAAQADELHADASNDSLFNQRIVHWYDKPMPQFLPNVGSIYKNYYGIWDMHGLTFEWVQDYNGTLSSGESRSDSSLDKDLFCGGAAINAKNLKNYGAYMRYAMRASLKGNYTIGSLGFRCAK